jgi:hypothetical protein
MVTVLEIGNSPTCNTLVFTGDVIEAEDCSGYVIVNEDYAVRARRNQNEND